MLTRSCQASQRAGRRDDARRLEQLGGLRWLLRAEIGSTTTGKLGGLLIRPAARRLRTRFDPDTYGGAYLLGLRGLAVIAHGNSSRTAIANAIRLAARGVEQGVVDRLRDRLSGDLRRETVIGRSRA